MRITAVSAAKIGAVTGIAKYVKGPKDGGASLRGAEGVGTALVGASGRRNVEAVPVTVTIAERVAVGVCVGEVDGLAGLIDGGERSGGHSGGVSLGVSVCVCLSHCRSRCSGDCGSCAGLRSSGSSARLRRGDGSGWRCSGVGSGAGGVIGRAASSLVLITEDSLEVRLSLGLAETAD